MKLKLYLLATLLPFIWIGCNPTFNNIEEYREWVFSEESGYMQEVVSGDFKFQLIHYPASLEEQGESTSEIESDQTIRKFQLKISSTAENMNLLKAGLENEELYKKRIHQLEFELEPLFSAFSSDSLKPIFSHYENYRGLKNEVLLHLHFSTEKELKDDFKVLFNDEVFNTGKHQFVFEQDKINYIPTFNKANHE